MSDVVRNYSMGGSPRKRRRDLRRRGGQIGLRVLFLALVCVVGGCWYTRDSHDMGGLVPAKGALQACVTDVMRKQSMAASSQLWGLLPAESPVRESMRRFAENPPLPEWLLNNLSTDVAWFSCDSLSAPEDMLVVTKMTRTGCLAAKLARLDRAVERDHAGGLNLFSVPEAGLYYAVRGRVLLLSRSRSVLVRALTLDKDALGEAGLREWRAGAAGADVFGKIEPAPFFFDRLQFSLRLTPGGIDASLSGTPDETMRKSLDGLLAKASPQTLKTPPAGMVSLSADFGRPLAETLALAADLYGQGAPVRAWLSGENAASEGDYGPLSGLARAVVNSAGGGLRVAWQGVDVNEMVPAPVFTATIDGGVDPVAAMIQQPPAPPVEPPEIDLLPRVDAEAGVIHVPLVGGPSIEPSFAVYGEGVALGTSLTELKALLAAPAAPAIAEKGNLYLSVRPGEAVKAALDTGREFAEFGFVRDETPDSLSAKAQPWVDMAGKIGEVSLLAAHENGAIRMDARLVMP